MKMVKMMITTITIEYMKATAIAMVDKDKDEDENEDKDEEDCNDMMTTVTMKMEIIAMMTMKSYQG